MSGNSIQEDVGIVGAFARPVGMDRSHEFTRTWLTALVLGVVALTTFLWRINVPSSPFYDEIQYLNSARAFLSETSNPNPEAPPLGKLLIAAGIKIFGDNPVGWRAMSAIFGALTLGGMFFWVYLLLRDYALALTAATLALFNNFLYVMSRVAMMDIFLVTFLVLGLVAFTGVLEIHSLTAAKRRSLLASAGTLFGFAIACKWNGVDTLGIVILVSALLWGTTQSQNPQILRYRRNLMQVGIVPSIFFLLVVPIVAYCVTYWPLCHSLHRSFGIGELVSMNLYIWRFHRAVAGNPAIASPWYSWIFQVAPQRALSYLVGNWVIMWSGLLALGFCALRMKNRVPETLVVLLYLGSLLQWAITPQKLLYYYYYFPAAMFLGVAIPVALHQVSNAPLRQRLTLLCVVAAGCAFLFCFPHMAHLEAPFDCALGCWP
jgi:dolichyl-phosphate-mannose--protein O-mannosyl transferase